MSTRKLLLADDSITIQKVVKLTFAGEDIEVMTVGDGDAAMKKFGEATPDLVMADVNMPGLDGYRICETIKQNPETTHIPVILLVGSFEPFDETEAERVGADDYLTKPFHSIRQLVDKVSDLLGERKIEENSPPPIENRSAPAAGDFYDTPETPPSNEVESADDLIERFDDAGMDDEMIQTARLSAAEEKTSGYESEPIDEYFPEEKSPTHLKPPYKSVKSPVELKTKNEDRARTPLLSPTDIEEIPAISEMTVERKTALTSNFEAFDALEFPQLTQKAVADQIVLQTGSGIYDETLNKNDWAQTQISEENTANAEKSPSSENFSPQVIEAIADKVVERLSGELIEKIVREVIAQMKEKE